MTHAIYIGKVCEICQASAMRMTIDSVLTGTVKDPKNNKEWGTFAPGDIHYWCDSHYPKREQEAHSTASRQ